MTKLGNFVGNVGEMKHGKTGMPGICESFLSELDMDPNYKGMDDATKYTKFVMNCAALL